MPWWAAGYFGLYLAFSTWSLVDDYRSKESTNPRMVVEIASDILLLVPALAFWRPELAATFAPALLPSFVVGIMLFAGLMVAALRKHVAPDPELSLREKLGVGIAGSVLGLVVSAPLLVWAFRAAIMGEHVDT
jgi:hypothetical protein